MNVDNRFYPRPHPGWGQSAEDLFFYTSRYAHHSKRMLEKMCGRQATDTTGFRASGIDPAQRLKLAQVFACPPSVKNATRLLALISEFSGAAIKSGKINRRSAKTPRPFMQDALERPAHASASLQTHPLSELDYLAQRYHFVVNVKANTVWLDSECCNRLLQHGSVCVRDNLLEVLQHLNRCGYQVRSGHVSVVTATQQAGGHQQH